MRKELLWFGAGFAIAAVLSVSYEAVNFLPMGVAFGLLCFGCGVVLVMFWNLKRQEDSARKASLESYARWSKEFDELAKKKTALEAEQADLEEEKAGFEAEKELWNAVHGDEPETEESK